MRRLTGLGARLSGQWQIGGQIQRVDRGANLVSEPDGLAQEDQRVADGEGEIRRQSIVGGEVNFR